MRGIRLAHGVVFVTDGLNTVRLLPSGECGISPILYGSLEWDLRTEPPEQWEYLSESQIRNLPNGGYDKIMAVFAEIGETPED